MWMVLSHAESYSTFLVYLLTIVAVVISPQATEAISDVVDVLGSLSR